MKIKNGSWGVSLVFVSVHVLSVLLTYVLYFQLPVEVSNSDLSWYFAAYFENEHLNTSFTAFGYDIWYLLNAPSEELKLYYPNFYQILYWIGIGVRYVLPLGLIILGIYKLIINWRSIVIEKLKKIESKLQVRFLMVAMFLFAVSSYLLFQHYYTVPFRFQMVLARIYLVMNILVLSAAAIVRKEQLIKGFQAFVFKPNLPYALAITRILFFSYSVFLYLVIFRIGHGSNLGELEKVALPGIGWLIEIIPVNSEIYAWFCYAGAFVSLMIVLGFRTRFFLFLNAILVFYVVATPNFFGKLWHEQIVIWISWILAFSPCADVLSLDAALKGRSKPQAKPIYGYHLKIIWLHFGLIYFFAGFFKLWESGFAWALSDSMIRLVQIEWFEHFDTVSSWRVDKIPVLLKIGGLGVIMFEMAYLFMLFKKRLKWVSVFGALAMHNFLGKVMYISFFSLLQVFYLVFIPWNWILTKIGLVSQSSEVQTVRPKFTSILILAPLIMLGMNAFCGVFMINSYPFSIYPVYTDILPDNVKYFEYRILDDGHEDLDFREEGRKANFRWEDFSRHEYHLIRSMDTEIGLDTAEVKKLWKRWQLGVQSLSSIDSVDIYLVERPLDPEKANETISSNFLMSIYHSDEVD